MSGRWFGRRGRIALLIALLIAWGTVLYATRTPGPRGSARAASGPLMPAAAPASRAASAPGSVGGNAVPAVHQR